MLSNRRGTRVCVLDLGGIVQEFSVLADGVRETPRGVVRRCGFLCGQPFQINKQIGRVAGRIRGAAFDINGRTYRVEANEVQERAARGGSHGLAVTRFNAVAADGRSVKLRSRLQQSAVDGYPNDLDLDISRTAWTRTTYFTVSYRATALGFICSTRRCTFTGGWTRACTMRFCIFRRADIFRPMPKNRPSQRFQTTLKYLISAVLKPLDAAVAALRRETGRAWLDDAYRVPSDIGRSRRCVAKSTPPSYQHIQRPQRLGHSYRRPAGFRAARCGRLRRAGDRGADAARQPELARVRQYSSEQG